MVSQNFALAAFIIAAATASQDESLEKLEARQGAIIDGFKSGMTNFQQTVDTLTHQLKTNGAHAGADVVGTFLTGIDAQIDNAGGTIASALAPLTGGLSLAVGNFLLGPFVQSVTNGAEVAIGNIVGGAADLVAAPIRMAFSNSLTNLAAQARRYNIDASRLEAANNQLKSTFAISVQKRDNSQGAIIDGFKSGMINFQQTVDTLTHQLRTNGAHAGADVVGTFLTGIDAQIDNAGGTIATALAPLTGGLSLAVGNFLLGPFVQSVTNGAEVAIGNIVGGAADLVAAPVRMAFSNSLTRLAAQARQYNIDTTRLEAANHQLKATFAAAHKRDNQGAIIDGFKSGMTNFQQTVDTLTHQLRTNGAHAGADVVGTFLTGIDAQIDNAGGTIATALAPLTGGLSLAVGNFLLGPFVQSVTNGAEVAIGNIVGGAADLVAAPVRMAFSNSLTRLATQAKQYNIDTSRLEALNHQLKATFA